MLHLGLFSMNSYLRVKDKWKGSTKRLLKGSIILHIVTEQMHGQIHCSYVILFSMAHMRDTRYADCNDLETLLHHFVKT